MKNSYIFRLANKLIWIVLAIFALSFSGVKTQFDFVDTSNSYFDVYPGKYITIASIEDTEKISKPVRIQSDKTYDNLSFLIDGEILTFDNGFTFTDIDNGSFTIEYNANLDSFLLYRDFSHLNGWSTVGLAAIIMILINGISLILEIVVRHSLKKEHQTIFYKSNAQKTLNVFNRLIIVFLSSIGIVAIVSIFGFDFLSFIDTFTDITLMWGGFGILSLTFTGLLLYEFLTPSLQIKIENNNIEVIEKNDILFYAPLSEVVYSYKAIRNAHAGSSTYTVLTVTLDTKEHRTTGINIDFIPLGDLQYLNFIQLLDDQSTHLLDDHESRETLSTKFTFKAQQSRNTVIFLLSVFTLLPLAIFSPIIFGTLDSSYLITMMIILVLFIVAIVLFLIGTRKKVTFEVLENGIKINDILYNFTNITKIEMSTPFEQSNMVRKFKIVTHSKTIKYTINENMNHSISQQQYQNFAKTLKVSYPEVIFK